MKLFKDYKEYETFYDQNTKYETRFVNLSNGETVGFRDAGEGPPILLLHANF